ncbi:MAG: non-hydrolyzing UDP-N-acetylglucosamine 2-epimerase [Alphaproteobacteria bacterium]
MSLKLLSVVGARPNFMKIAAVCEAIKEFNQLSSAPLIHHLLVHTGQHYDANMSDSFFNDLELPKPDISLGVGSGSHSVQTAKIMERFESVVLNERPHVVMVVGDVNSTVACALVTTKTLCSGDAGGPEFIPKLAHVEAGLRSFDRTMPEEINRIVTDSVSDYLFTTEDSANENLLREGVAPEKIFFVGNVMIDTLLRHRAKAAESTILQDLQLCEAGGVNPYVILTLHRPTNVDDERVFSRMIEAFLEISKRMPVIFPAHPRTLKRIQEADLGDYFVDHFVQGPEAWDSRVRIRLIPPLGYLDFLHLMSNAKVVMTDSGGVQEETTILGVPCVTLRENTERPVTVEEGSNVLVGSKPENIVREFNRVWRGSRAGRCSPRFWDGHAARRIIKVLARDYLPGAAISIPSYESSPKELAQN